MGIRGATTGLVLLALAGGACAREHEVWLTPNLGSPDMVQLFARPEEWKRARGRVDVFKFYSQQVLLAPDECPFCEGNTLSAFEEVGAFAKLREWGIRVSVEVGVVKPGFCTAGVSASRAARAVETVETLGGAVASLSMDEPLAASDACGLDLAATAEETAAFVRRLRGSRPSVVVGDIEPYPLFDVATLGIWLDALAARDARPDFFHLDVDRATAARRGIDVAAGLKGVRALCAERSLPFGVLLYGGDGVDDAGYFAAVLSWTDEVAAAVGMPDHVVFQSFSMSSAGLFDVPRNLPEGDPKVFSHTRLVLDGLAEFGRTGHALR